MKVFITYSDQGFKKQRDFAVLMAKMFGNFDKSIAYKPEDIDRDFYSKHQHILSQAKGGGYWLWKPYFILKTLLDMREGDYLFYADAGSFFLKNVDPIIGELEGVNQCIAGFDLPLVEIQWTKRELLIEMGCDSPVYTDGNHILSSFHLIKKSDRSVKFYEDYLKLCCESKKITDIHDPNVSQYSEFIDHRQDQSIFSLLFKRHKLKTLKDPSQFGEYPTEYAGKRFDGMKPATTYKLDNGRLFRYYQYNSKYKFIIFHYRRGSPLLEFVKFKIKEALILRNYKA